MSPSGETAIAFINMDNVDEALFDDPSQIPSREEAIYHLMLIDAETLSFKTLPLGDVIPRYALTPNGQMLIVEDAEFRQSRANMRILDIDTLTLHPVEGPKARLLHYVMTSDSSRALLIDEHLYELAINERRVERIDLGIKPRQLNLTPDDRHLLIRDRESKIWVYDLTSRELTHKIELPWSLQNEYRDEYEWY